jgi:4a-hydroxytetrahydrobiopterin dehydratase
MVPMHERTDHRHRPLTRQQASDAVGHLGWRFVLGVLRTQVAVESLMHGATAAAAVVEVAGDDADGHLWQDVRRDHLVLSLQTLATATVTGTDVDLAARITRTLADRGLHTDPHVAASGPRSVQLLEIAVDAIDIGAVRPFWKAVLGYADEAGNAGPTDPLVDPLGQGPAIWFQQMAEPRPERNRIHLDVSVPHDEAPHRIRAALAAGGTLRSDGRAPSFWVLADAEGNEVCITTWQGRDP